MANVIVKRTSYTAIPNAVLRDKNLSLKARGLLCFCLSLSDNWKYSIQGLATAAGAGIDAIKSGLKELEKAGYLVRKKYRDESGRMACDYEIYDSPVAQIADIEEAGKTAAENSPVSVHNGNTNAEKPVRENRGGKTAAENPPVINKQEEITKRINSSSSNNIYNNARTTEPCVSAAATARDTNVLNNAHEAIVFWMNNTGQAGEVIRSDIAELVGKHGNAFVIEAMREAIRSNVRKIKYVRAILERMANGEDKKQEASSCGIWEQAFKEVSKQWQQQSPKET